MTPTKTRRTTTPKSPSCRRGPQKTPTKVQVTLRLSPQVIAHYKAAGKGWQTRIDEALRKVIARDT